MAAAPDSAAPMATAATPAAAAAPTMTPTTRPALTPADEPVVTRCDGLVVVDELSPLVVRSPVVSPLLVVRSSSPVVLRRPDVVVREGVVVVRAHSPWHVFLALLMQRSLQSSSWPMRHVSLQAVCGCCTQWREQRRV